MSAQLFEAKNFGLVQGELMGPARATSSRDYRLEIRLPFYRNWSLGQFVMLRWGQHLVGRPFAIVDWNKRKTETDSVLSVWIRRLGAATEELFQTASKGQKVWVTAPLGTGYEYLLSEERLLFLSGGVGAASLLPLFRARQLQGTGKDDFWIHGERDTAALDQEWACGDAKFAPHQVYFEAKEESKSQGAKTKSPSFRVFDGRITKAFEGALDSTLLAPFSAAVACGPSAMLEAVSLKLKSDRHFAELPLYLGLEEKMGCGMGLCFSCSVSTKEGLKRCCLEGPWYEAAQLLNHFSFRKTGQL